MDQIDIDRAKDGLLSDQKIALPKSIILIGFMSSIMFKPVALLAYIPIILYVISLLTGLQFTVTYSFVAVCASLCCLLFLSITSMRSMDNDGVLELYLALIFDVQVFPRFLMSAFKNQTN